MQATITCWIKDVLNMKGPEYWSECIRADSSVQQLLTRIKLTVVLGVLLCGIALWRGYSVPPVVLRVLVGLVAFGVLLNQFV